LLPDSAPTGARAFGRGPGQHENWESRDAKGRQNLMERDRAGEPFQDDFTENRGPDPVEKEKIAEKETPDPDVDSQAGDEAMADDVFGVNDPK
jgi:hypothetical protein